jgi:hypothetical protein
MPGILRATPGGSQSATPSRQRAPRQKAKGIRQTIMGSRERVREPRVYAAIQNAPIPLARSTNVSKRETMLAERSQELRAVYARTGMKLRRWFRTGELVWCALTTPIVGQGDGVVIRFWPGLVEEARLKSSPKPREPAPSVSNHADKQIPRPDENPGDVVIEDPGVTVPWTVEQSTMYKIQLLAVTCPHVVPDDQVLPYQAHVPPNELIAGLQAYPVEKLDFSRDMLSRFNPCPGDAIQPDFEEAIAPFAMAVQIGSALSGYWNLTDDWAFEYTAPRAPIARPGPSSSTTSVSAALEAASLHNSQVNAYTDSSISSGPSSRHYPNAQYHPVTGPSRSASSSELQKLSGSMLGKAPPPARPGEALKHYTQIRFQGLWWGAERIWVDEFIRLKVPRRCLAPNGAENIFPPSGPGKSAREMWLSAGRDLSEIGAGMRGVFMRLDALFVVDATQPDGFTKKECRASGMLYELADFDWEDDEPNKGTSAPVVDGTPMTNHSPSVKTSSQPAQPSRAPSNTDLPIPTSSAQVQKSRIPTPNDQLSHPAERRHPLPQAPEGYRFRPILPEGYEAVVSLSLISGRYYSDILSHPLLQPTLQEAISHPTEQGGLLEFNNLWALEGLSAGYYNSVDPAVYKTSRAKMVEDADKTAARELEEHKQEKAKEQEDGMELDDGGAEIDQLVYSDLMDVDHV